MLAWGISLRYRDIPLLCALLPGSFVESNPIIANANQRRSFLLFGSTTRAFRLLHVVLGLHFAEFIYVAYLLRKVRFSLVAAIMSLLGFPMTQRAMLLAKLLSKTKSY